MIKLTMNFLPHPKNLFVCELTDTALKVLKVRSGPVGKSRDSAAALRMIAADITDEQLLTLLRELFASLGYDQGPVSLVLPRHKVACRRLKIPSATPQETDKIVSLQAPRYLPYPAQELLNGYQVIAVDQSGYTDISLMMVHQPVVERLMKLAAQAHLRITQVVTSTSGLATWYGAHTSASQALVMLVDRDAEQIELVVTESGKDLFSRSVKSLGAEGQQAALLATEINRTKEAYLKENPSPPLEKVLLLQSPAATPNLDALALQVGLPVEVLPLPAQAGLDAASRQAGEHAQLSFASLIAVGLTTLPATLNLLPAAAKLEAAQRLRIQHRLRLGLCVAGILGLWLCGIQLRLQNKTREIARLKTALSKISQEAAPLEGMERRLAFMAKRSTMQQSATRLFYELHRVIPASIKLSLLSFEDSQQLLLRGEAEELNAVLGLVGQLEKSPFFSGFQVKIRYATQHKTQGKETVEFEIGCVKPEA